MSEGNSMLAALAVMAHAAPSTPMFSSPLPKTLTKRPASVFPQSAAAAKEEGPVAAKGARPATTTSSAPSTPPRKPASRRPSPLPLPITPLAVAGVYDNGSASDTAALDELAQQVNDGLVKQRQSAARCDELQSQLTTCESTVLQLRAALDSEEAGSRELRSHLASVQSQLAAVPKLEEQMVERGHQIAALTAELAAAHHAAAVAQADLHASTARVEEEEARVAAAAFERNAATAARDKEATSAAKQLAALAATIASEKALQERVRVAEAAKSELVEKLATAEKATKAAAHAARAGADVINHSADAVRTNAESEVKRLVEENKVLKLAVAAAETANSSLETQVRSTAAALMQSQRDLEAAELVRNVASAESGKASARVRELESTIAAVRKELGAELSACQAALAQAVERCTRLEAAAEGVESLQAAQLAAFETLKRDKIECEETTRAARLQSTLYVVAMLLLCCALAVASYKGWIKFPPRTTRST